MIVKNDDDREILREGGKRIAHILAKLSAMVTPGVSTLALEDRARQLIAEAGGEAATLDYTPQGARRPYPAALCISINDAIVHGIPNEQPVIFAEGDIVTIDCVFAYQGLMTDAARCLDRKSVV